MGTTPKTKSVTPFLDAISAEIAARTATPAYVSPALRIASRGVGFRRAGLSFTKTPEIYPPGRFTAEQVLMLKSSTDFLVVDEIDTNTGKIAAAFDPAQTESQLIDHLAADPAGLTTILQGLGFVPKATAAPAPVVATTSPSAPAPPAPPPASGTDDAAGAGAAEGAAA